METKCINIIKFLSSLKKKGSKDILFKAQGSILKTITFFTEDRSLEACQALARLFDDVYEAAQKEKCLEILDVLGLKVSAGDGWSIIRKGN